MNKLLIVTASAIIGSSLILAAMPAMARPSVDLYVTAPAVYVQPAPVYVERVHQRNWRERRWEERRAAQFHRDRDHDGIPNRYDRDRDGDGVPNRFDRRPDNPYRY